MLNRSRYLNLLYLFIALGLGGIMLALTVIRLQDRVQTLHREVASLTKQVDALGKIKPCPMRRAK